MGLLACSCRQNDECRYITGHSLGGAMATVMASEFLLGDTPGTFGPVQVITFAAPRSGNPSYATGIGSMKVTWWTVQNFFDQIPHLPTQSMGACVRACGRAGGRGGRAGVGA